MFHLKRAYVGDGQVFLAQISALHKLHKMISHYRCCAVACIRLHFMPCQLLHPVTGCILMSATGVCVLWNLAVIVSDLP